MIVSSSTGPFMYEWKPSWDFWSGNSSGLSSFYTTNSVKAPLVMQISCRAGIKESDVSLPSGVCWWSKKGWGPADLFLHWLVTGRASGLSNSPTITLHGCQNPDTTPLITVNKTVICVVVKETLWPPENRSLVSHSETDRHWSTSVSSPSSCPITTSGPIAPPTRQRRNLSDDPLLHSHQKQVSIAVWRIASNKISKYDYASDLYRVLLQPEGLFPLPEFTGRVDSPRTLVHFLTPVNSGSGNRMPVYTGVRFPLPKLTARVDGCQKMHPSSRAVISGCELG